MSLIIYLFEDHTYQNFYPLTYNRTVYELLFGAMKLREKVALHFPNAEIRLLCRDYLQPLLEQKTKLKVNDFNLSKADRILLLNGRAILDSTSVSRIDFDQEKSYWHKEELVAVILSAEKFKKHFYSIRSL